MSRILTAAFFDDAALVGVRLAKTDADADANDPVVAFASAPPRKFMAPPKESGCTAPALIALGVIIAFVGGSVLLSTCHDRTVPAPASVPAAPPAPAAPPPIRVSAPCGADCDGSPAWKNALAALDAKLEPRQAAWKPWFTRTLLRLPQTDPADWQTPRVDAADLAARDAALELAGAFAAVDSAPDTAIVLDLPGPPAVAAAGALADRFEPVFTFDNIPDGAGVVPAQDALGAVLYWLPRLQRGAQARGDKTCAPVFVLDANRLSPYRNEADRFDNRYKAKLPDAGALKAAGVKRVLYVRPTAGAITDSDDLNETLVAWQAADVEVKALGLSALMPASVPADAPPPADAPVVGAPAASPAPTHVYHHHYGTGWTPWFWHGYGWYGPTRPLAGAAPQTPPPSDGAWSPRPRAGLFSGLAAPPPGGTRRPAAPPSSVWPGGRSSSGGSSYSGGGSHRPSSSSPGGSWGRSSGGSTFS